MATINFTVNVDSIEELHKVLKEIISNSPKDEITDYMESLSEEGILPTPNHPPIPEDAVGTPVDGGLDSEGLPWDERIHSSRKSKTKSDTWKILRIPKHFNNDENAWHTYINEIKAELAMNLSHDHYANESENPAGDLDDPNKVFGDPQQEATVSPPENEMITFDGVLEMVRDIEPMLIMSICKQMNIVNIFQLEQEPDRITEFHDLLKLAGH